MYLQSSIVYQNPISLYCLKIAYFECDEIDPINLTVQLVSFSYLPQELILNFLMEIACWNLC